MEFSFINSEGKVEKKPIERWGWGVIYEDGTRLEEFSRDGTYHEFKEIDQARVRNFRLIRLHEEGRRIDYDVEPGASFKLEKKDGCFCFTVKQKDGKEWHNYILPNEKWVQSEKMEDTADLLKKHG